MWCCHVYRYDAVMSVDVVLSCVLLLHCKTNLYDGDLYQCDDAKCINAAAHQCVNAMQ